MNIHSKHSSTASLQKWWKEQIVYQIYPRSFKDSTGSGVGDLRGIIDKLDYIESLGITAVWINPIYASPNDDNGYDISDYRAIMQEFGNMDDFDELLNGLHKRGIKFIMDLVLNHTSDEHPWFEQSRSSRDNPYRDYYHWWPAEKGKPHFRWSYFDEKGEAWKYDEASDAYYLHYFSQKQPDLNWENPKVRQEIFDIMKFWAEKGIDGFRLDAFQFISKDPSFPKLPSEYENDIANIIKYHGMGDNIHTYLQEMYDQVLSKYKVFAVSEGTGSSFEDAHKLVDEQRNELQVAYHFECVDMKVNVDKPHTLADFKHVHSSWDKAFEKQGWLAVFLANHDQPRMVSKFGNDSAEFRQASAKMLNTFILTMRGTPFCYFGDELGMTNIDFTSIEQYKDVAAINGYKKTQYQGKDIGHYMRHLRAYSRDHSRTPMQWDNSKHAGFTLGEPWITINSNYTHINAAAQKQSPSSILSHFKALTALRKNTKVLVYGDYELLMPEHEHVYAYKRTLEGKTMYVVLNFSEYEQRIDSSQLPLPDAALINNYTSLTTSSDGFMLMPYQAIVY